MLSELHFIRIQKALKWMLC